QSVRQRRPRVEITRVEVGDELRALLVLGPEPIDWTRTALTVSRGDDDHLRDPARAPGALKLTGATFATLRSDDESVSLVTRSELDPSGARVEVRRPPG